MRELNQDLVLWAKRKTKSCDAITDGRQAGSRAFRGLLRSSFVPEIGEVWLDSGTDQDQAPSNLVALRSDMPASVAGTAHRRFISWASRCTALAIGKATFGLDCVRKSHDCDGR